MSTNSSQYPDLPKYQSAIAAASAALTDAMQAVKQGSTPATMAAVVQAERNQQVAAIAMETYLSQGPYWVPGQVQGGLVQFRQDAGVVTTFSVPYPGGESPQTGEMSVGDVQSLDLRGLGITPGSSCCAKAHPEAAGNHSSGSNFTYDGSDNTVSYQLTGSAFNLKFSDAEFMGVLSGTPGKQGGTPTGFVPPWSGIGS